MLSSLPFPLQALQTKDWSPYPEHPHTHWLSRSMSYGVFRSPCSPCLITPFLPCPSAPSSDICRLPTGHQTLAKCWVYKVTVCERYNLAEARTRSNLAGDKKSPDSSFKRRWSSPSSDVPRDTTGLCLHPASHRRYSKNTSETELR